MRASDAPPRLVYGPYKRLMNDRTQDAATIVKQVLSGELWGKKPSFGLEAAAQAYRGALRDDQEGFEFWSFQAPDNKDGHVVYWGQVGDFLTADDNLEVVKLQIAFVRITQSLHALAP